jgi:prophage tail gpP-like protein
MTDFSQVTVTGNEPVPEIAVETRSVIRPWPRPDLGPKREETATLIVAGLRFEDWESVWVQLQLSDAYSQFRFTAAERDPLPDWWERLQFKPQDPCQIYLGGLLAFTGVIILRQVAYAGKQHGVVLQGVSDTWFAARASILDKDSQFKGGFLDVAKQVLAPTGVGFEVLGEIDSTPFKPPVKNQPGEPIFSFLERIGRDRKVIVAATREGKFLFIGEHGPRVIDRLIEGVNILKMQCVISVVLGRSLYATRGQKPRSDEGSPTDAAHQEATAPGTMKRYSPLLTIMEHPVWTPHEVALRNDTEVMWNEGTIIEATITVQGWFTSAGALWQAGADVMVQSPMAMLNMVLSIQTVTFTQDSGSGSLSTLVCVAPWRLNGSRSYAVQNPQSPEASKSNTAPAQTPPTP